MSEEVLNNLFELRNLEDDKARKYTLYRKIEKYITDLQQENEQLKEDKKKIIEYINKNILVGFNEVGFKSDIVAGIVVNDLLKILGDKK